MKDKNNIIKMPKEVSASLFTLVVIVATLGITLPLHFIFPNVLTTYWVIAICVAVISPFALVNAKINFEAKGNYTEEQKKAATTKIGIAMLSIWYADFTFICMFMDWLIAFFILAELYLIKMIYNVASVLVNRKDATTYPNFLIIGDFVLSFLLLILLIYKIPDQTLQTIVVTMSAALIGGLLTLIGVIMTIKKSDNDRKEEEIKKAKPIVFVIGNNNIKKEPTTNIKIMSSLLKKGTLKSSNESESSYLIRDIVLSNSDNSYVTIRGFKINEDYHIFDRGQILDKNTRVLIRTDYRFTYKRKIKDVSILIEDLLYNLYELPVEFHLTDEGKMTIIHFDSGYEIKKSNIVLYDEES